MPREFDLYPRGRDRGQPRRRGLRDIGVRDGRIAEIGDLERRRRRRARRLPGPAHPARRDRQPGAFPRAGPRTQGGSGDRLARGGARRRDGRVRDAQHRARRRPARTRSRTSSRARKAACIAISPSGSAARTKMSPTFPSSSACPARRGSRCSWAPRPARCWSPTMRACGDPRKDPPPRRLPQRGRGAAQRAQGPARRRRSLVASRLARRDRGAALHRAAGSPRARGARASACAAYLDPPGDRLSRQREGRRELRGDAASSDAERRGLRAARHEIADEPAGARPRASRRDLARPCAGDRRRPRLRPRAAYARRRKPSPIPRARRA